MLAHSTGVAHHTAICGPASASAFTSCDRGSKTKSGSSAEESQNLTRPTSPAAFALLQESLQQPPPGIGGQ